MNFQHKGYYVCFHVGGHVNITTTTLHTFLSKEEADRWACRQREEDIKRSSGFHIPEGDSLVSWTTHEECDGVVRLNEHMQYERKCLKCADMTIN